jgi:hypothetical protein
MGFYIRKAFKAGPFRLNLSKSGLGVSFGVKGARIGSGPRGSYVHAGRYGLYYRQQLSSNKHSYTQSYRTSGTGRSRELTSEEKAKQDLLNQYISTIDNNSSTNDGCLKIIIIVVLLVIAGYIISYFATHTTILFIILGVIGLIFLVVQYSYFIKKRAEKAENILINSQLRDYKELLDKTFLSSDEAPDSIMLAKIKVYQDNNLTHPQAIIKEKDIERNVYHALLDKILDDKKITEVEANTIRAADEVFKLCKEEKDNVKKEIFVSGYLKAVEDKVLNPQEVDYLKNLVSGLNIPNELIEKEISTVNEIIRAQEISLPLPEIPDSSIPVNLLKTEKAFYTSHAKVLIKQKLISNHSEEEFRIERAGLLVVTNKRLFVVGEGSTNIKFQEIAYVDVDLDEKYIEITKTTSRKAIFIKNDEPIITAKIIQLLSNQE